MIVNNKIQISLLASMVLCLGIVVSSCKSDPNSPGIEYMPDMYRSPSYETYGENHNAYLGGKDSMEARTPAPGTIPRGYTPYPYPDSNEGYEKAGKELTNPIELNEKTLEEGKILYGKYCQHCHGEKGEGDGPVIVNADYAVPPSYASGKSSRGGAMKEMAPGKIYHTIMYGLNLMGSHASQLTIEERWKIVYYVQKLQGKELLSGGEESENKEESITEEDETSEGAVTDTTEEEVVEDNSSEEEATTNEEEEKQEE